MFVAVFPNSLGTYKGKYLRIAVHIQRGEFDNQLQWPFKGKVTVQAYNSTIKNWSNNLTIELNEEECGRYYVERCFDVQTYGGWGYNDFLSHSELYEHYIKNPGSVAKFRVAKVES